QVSSRHKGDPTLFDMSKAAHYLSEGKIPCASHTLIRVPSPRGSNFLLDPPAVSTATIMDMEVVEIKGQAFGEYVVGLLSEIEQLEARLMRASEKNDVLRNDLLIAKRLLGEDAIRHMRTSK